MLLYSCYLARGKKLNSRRSAGGLRHDQRARMHELAMNKYTELASSASQGRAVQLCRDLLVC